MKKIYILAVACLSASLNQAQSTSVTFTSSGTFTVPAGVTEVTIEVIGAGGDGASNGGGGGGGGGYASGTFSVTPGANLSVTVGVHGMGTSGGGSSVAGLLAASGGMDGNSGGASPGGAAGVGTGGTVNHSGGHGGNGTWTYFGGGGGGAAGPSSNGTNGGNTIPWTGICMTPGGTAGANGGSPGGDGGKGAGFTDASCTATDPADGGSSYGGGGGGGNGIGSLPGEGSNGYVVISYCTLDLSTTVTGVTITANAVSPTSYQWINCATNLPIPGETNASYTATANGNYAVIIEDGDCMDTSACVSITSVGVNDIKAENTFQPHPNPFTGKLIVDGATGKEDYTLTNSQGKIVWNGRHIEQTDFSSLPEGVYILKIQSEKAAQTISLIKK